ncbi:MAG: alcohol dehydrogenase catalytic domain-containing protein [Chloroflexi bacterium]|nr:alcohol dehydrogenase catalytic domain-containing protein [Chloroflexota bacterium]
MKVHSFALHAKEDLRSLEWDIPEIEPGGVLLRVIACGICGSDLRMFYEGPSPRYTLPIVLGHEFTGTVVQVGANVKSFKPGDVAAVAPLIPCMSCRPCSHGQDNLCETGQVIGTHIAGAMADHFYVPERMVSDGGLVKLPAGADPRVSALTEIVGCCLHGIRQTDFQVGDSVLIIGEGPIGLAHLQLLRLMGAGQIVMTGLIQNRLKLAEELGASVALDVGKHDLKQYAQDKGFKPDLAIVATPVMPASELALELLRWGGTLLLFSGYPYGTTMTLDAYRFHYAEKHIHGSIDCNIRDFQNATELLPRLQMGRLITQAFPLKDTLQAFRAARNPEAIKTMIEA